MSCQLSISSLSRFQFHKFAHSKEMLAQQPRGLNLGLLYPTISSLVQVMLSQVLAGKFRVSWLSPSHPPMKLRDLLKQEESGSR